MLCEALGEVVRLPQAGFWRAELTCKGPDHQEALRTGYTGTAHANGRRCGSLACKFVS
ncbi:hypothetical protein GCM10027062_40130 [Nocardioides hungaricus]